MIDKLYIKNFRSIKNTVFNDLGNMTVFVGANNAGKSTVLNALRVFNDSNYTGNKNDVRHGSSEFEITVVKLIDDRFYQLAYNQLKKTDYYDEFIALFTKDNPNRRKDTDKYKTEFNKYFADKFFLKRKNRKIGYKMTASLSNDNSHLEISKVLVNSDNKSVEIVNGIALDFCDKWFELNIANIDDERRFSDEVRGDSKSITNSVFSLFVSTISNDSTYNIEDIQDKKGGDLSIDEINYLLSHKTSKKSDIFLSNVNEKFSKYSENKLEVQWKFDDNIQSRIKLETQFVNESNQNIDFLSTGSGTRSLYMLSLLESYVEVMNTESEISGLFLIEEPELYLYPKLERKLGIILKEISSLHQVVITSHSSGLVSQFNKEDIYIADNSQSSGANKFSKYSKLNDYNDIVSELGFDGHNLFGKKYIILVEGKDDIKEYGSLIKERYRSEHDKCCFIKVNSVKNIETAITCQLIRDSNQFTNLFIITDSDGRHIDKINNQYKESLKNSFDDNEINELISNRLYVTENAMNLECFSISLDNINETMSLEDYAVKVNQFLIDNNDGINKELNSKVQRKLYTEEEKNQILDTLASNDINSILNTLTTKVLTKKLANIFITTVHKHKPITSCNSEYKNKRLPGLFNKLDILFN